LDSEAGSANNLENPQLDFFLATIFLISSALNKETLSIFLIFLANSVGRSSLTTANLVLETMLGKVIFPLRIFF
jgi:hypothetical protein